jgi:hypothetical protein
MMPIPKTNLSLKYLLLSQALIGALTAGIGGLIVNLQLGASIAVGAAFMLFTVLVFAWSWQRIFAKKSIAWTVLIIVFKYAFILDSIFLLMRTNWFSPLGAALGIASFTIAALVFAVVDQRKR